MIQELLKAAMEGKADGHPTQFPIQEYMVGIDGLPMTPDVGTTIGEHVQNRLSTADDNEKPAVPEPSVSLHASLEFLSVSKNLSVQSSLTFPSF